MKSEESLYIRVLLWAYEQSTEGFAESDLHRTFGLLQNLSLREWYQRVFRNTRADNTPLIDHFRTEDSISYHCLTEKGMSAAIDYLGLKEARESSKSAMRIAIGSLVLAALVGIVQILVQICH